MFRNKISPFILKSVHPSLSHTKKVLKCTLVNSTYHWKSPSEWPNKVLFPALNLSKTSATSSFDAHIDTKNDSFLNHVFKTKAVAELNGLHTVWEVQRPQLLTKLAGSVQVPHSAGFVFNKIAVSCKRLHPPASGLSSTPLSIIEPYEPSYD